MRMSVDKTDRCYLVSQTHDGFQRQLALNFGFLISFLLFVVFLTFQTTTALAQKFSYDGYTEVDVELILAVDISQSMDDDEQRIQREGYLAALTSEEVLRTIEYGPIGRIAVSYVEWGGENHQMVIADWQIIEDLATAQSFAAKIVEAPLNKDHRTSISTALLFSATHMENNQFEGMRRVIDISGDGPNNQGGGVVATRDAVISQGIVINGLPLMINEDAQAWSHLRHLDHYYEDCVIGGPGAFAIPVHSMSEFEDAIRMKLILEIAGLTPNPPGAILKANGRPLVRCDLYE